MGVWMTRSWWAFAALGLGCGANPEVTRPETTPVQEVSPLNGPVDGARYTLSFPDAHRHMVDVEATLSPPQGSSTQVMMAAWTPGSYLIREYARNVEGVLAFDAQGVSVPVTKVAKNRWDIGEAVQLRYRVYARDLSVQNSFVDESMAVLNGAPTFLVRSETLSDPVEVTLNLPDAWAEVLTQLSPHPDGAAHHYIAEDFDALVDSPIIAGDIALYRFEVDGVPHVLGNMGEAEVWDGPRSAADVERIVEVQSEFWGALPYEEYAFMNVLGQARGGLEHKSSTLMLADRWKTHERSDYVGWLGLVSHEFFHTWNVKRLRPQALGPFDYEHEVYTRDLWIAEGLTSYYDDLLLRRGGLITRDEYLQLLGKAVHAVQDAPGREVRSVAEASYDAWIKHYRPDENTGNTSVSYYRKGAVLGFLLDAEIRRVTTGRASLDDVMIRMYALYSGDRGYTSAQFLAVVEEVAGASFGPWFTAYVNGTQELSYEAALRWYGLSFREPTVEADEPISGWLGVHGVGDPVVLTRVPRGTPGEQAGLNVDDEIIAFDGFRATELSETLDWFPPGSEVEVLIARRGRMMTLSVTLGEAPQDTWDLEVSALSNGGQARHLDAWLGPDTER